MSYTNKMSLMVVNECIDMEMVKIKYSFNMGSGRREVFDMRFDADSLEMIVPHTTCLPAWTELDVNKCSHCELCSDTSPYCPVAANLAVVISRFDDVCSYNEIDLEVTTAERHVRQHTTVQRGLGAILGLMFATSGCSHTNFLKPMARFHLPLASDGETIFRTVGSYLIGQYFQNTDGQDSTLDLKGLQESYKKIHIVNRAIADRIRYATVEDASINAVILLDMFANMMPSVLEDHLVGLRHLWVDLDCHVNSLS